MGNYRVIGARRDDGHAVDEPIIADSADHAARRANELGILVSRIEPILTPATDVFRAPPPSRTRPGGAWRGFIRAIATIGAAILLIPGAALFLYTVLGVLAILFSPSPPNTDPSIRFAAGAFVGFMGVVWSVLAMLAGTILFLLLYIEEHLHRIAQLRGAH